MASEAPVGRAAWGESCWSSCRMRREGPSQRCSAGTARSLDVTRQHVGVLHEAWVLLADIRVYCTKVRVSCSTHNPWPVHPHPRAVAGLKGAPAGRGPLIEHHRADFLQGVQWGRTWRRNSGQENAVEEESNLD